MLGGLKSLAAKILWVSPLHGIASPGMSGKGGLGLMLVTLKNQVSRAQPVFYGCDNPPSIQ